MPTAARSSSATRSVLRPGDKVPVDGASSTGRPVRRRGAGHRRVDPGRQGPGDEVVGGSINRAGSVRHRATKVGADTALGQIVDAGRARAELQGARAAAGGPRRRSTGDRGGVRRPDHLRRLDRSRPTRASLTALTFAISAVVIACPDALGLATPTAVAVGTGDRRSPQHPDQGRRHARGHRRTRRDRPRQDRHADRRRARPHRRRRRPTGTTRPSCCASPASAERASEHPLAAAIVAGARERGLELDEPTDFEALPGLGLRADVDGHRVLIGNRKLLEGEQLAAGELRRGGRAVGRRRQDGRCSSSSTAAPPGWSPLPTGSRPTARAAIAGLKELGLEVVMITGDNERTATAVARELGIDRVFAEVLPAGQGRLRQAAAGRGQAGRDGRRRRQRRPGARAGRRRHRHRRRHRRGDRDRQRRADALDPLDIIGAIRLSRATDAQDEAEPRLGLGLQRAGHPASPPACSTRRSASSCGRNGRRC